jgi:dolichol-phosphate mannosyltransferase
MRRLVRLATDGILAFSATPLRVASVSGVLTAAAGVLYIAWAVVARLFLGAVPQGWASLIAIVLVVGGTQLVVIGVLGEYVARIYEETKHRPLYIVRGHHRAERRPPRDSSLG